MTEIAASTQDLNPTASIGKAEFFRFHQQHAQIRSVFGDDWLALKIEALARFFGTPKFLIKKRSWG